MKSVISFGLIGLLPVYLQPLKTRKRSLSEGEALVYFLKIRSRRKRQLKDAPIKFNIKMMI